MASPVANIFTDRRPFIEYQQIFTAYLGENRETISLKTRMEVSLQLAFADALMGNSTEAERLIRECGEYITHHGKAEEIALLYHIRSRLCLQHSDYEQALAEGLRGLYLFKQMDFLYFTKEAYLCCGVVCAQLNQYTEAIEYLTYAHTTALQMGDKKATILCTANLNDIRLNVLPAEECIRLNKELMLEIKEEFQDNPSTAEAGTCLQLANLYLKTGQLELADMYADKSLSVLAHLPHLPPHHFLFTNLYATKAEIAAGRGDEINMQMNANECSTRAKLINKVSPELDALLIQFRYYLNLDVDKSHYFLNKAAALVPETSRGSDYLNLIENKCLYYQEIQDSINEMVYFKLVHKHKIKVQQEAFASRTKYMTTIYELEMIQKEAELQKKALESKTLELNMTNYYLQQRNELLTELQNDIAKLQKKSSSATVIVRSISKKIKHAAVHEEADKMRFKEKFNEAHRQFILALHNQYNTLSNTECRICALLRSGFNTKDIAHLLSSSTRTIENHRATIRRKMQLDRMDNLNIVLARII